MSPLSLHTRTMLVSRLWMAMQFYFAHWQDVDPDFDLEADISDLMQVAIDTESRWAFTLAMIRFISRLNNSHTWYFDNQIFEERRQKRAYRLTALPDDLWMVKESYVDVLDAGDIITHIDDKPIIEWYNEVRPYINASSERIARRAFDGLLRLFISQHTTYTLSDGRQVLVNHDEAKDTQTLSDLHTTGRWVDDGDIALIHIPSFNEERFQDVALDYVEQFKDAHTIIFDMRDCTGGNTPSKLIRALMDRPCQMWTEATPANFALFHYRYQEREWGHAYTQDAEYKAYYDGMVSHFRRPMLMWSPSVTLPENPIYTGRILMLIGIEIGSAGEDFVIPFKSSGRATLIGENTLGSTGQPYHYRLIDDIWLAVGAKRAYMPDGSSYEGIGIAPDIHLQATVADLRAGRDVVLERALEMARSVATD